MPVPVPVPPIAVARLVLFMSSLSTNGLQAGSVTNWTVTVAVVDGLASGVSMSVRFPPGLEAQGPGNSLVGRSIRAADVYD